MRSPKVVLENLASHSNKAGYRYKKLYRNLYNPSFFLDAYQNIYAKEGNMTAGTDGLTIDGMSQTRIKELISKLKDCSYQPKPVRRVYIPKQNGKKRPLGIPSIEDKLVQEVLKNLLESIYEPTFSKYSHGFRPQKSCHTALVQIKGTFTGCRWFVEGDIEGFFDNIDHHTLINILRKRIEDEQFISLIWKFLTSGYLEEWKFHKTYSGTPQGGILSPLLANIYLNELDNFMSRYKPKFDVGKTRKINPVYSAIQHKLAHLRQELREVKGKNELRETEITKDINELIKVRDGIAAKSPMDSGYKRIQYVRYADDFLIGVIGSKEDAIKVKEDLANFLNTELKLTLSMEKTLITNTKHKVRFLGYDIKVLRDNQSKRRSNGVRTRAFSLKCEFYMPTDLIYSRLFKKGVIKVNQKTGQWKPIHRPALIKLEPLEILKNYNAEIRGTYQYYQLAVNVCHLNSYKYLLEYSMYKTLANKYRTTLAKAKQKFTVNGVFEIHYETKSGRKKEILYDRGFQRRKTPIYQRNVENFPSELNYQSRTSLIQRLMANKCEWCKTEEGSMEVHHVRRLKNLKGKKRWEIQMIARNRKTMVLCHKCHIDLHSGKLD
ncbi:reverse transcriptase domain-containing protein [Priestia endophytica]|uniref:reverse transcriptase domain-containing protein n=1 Tax=Priestia endophytica TaxID=135735 RepID=UPI0018D56168|nr:reverse transcriptase domain-containing protein [Priestia endophytica]